MGKRWSWYTNGVENISVKTGVQPPEGFQKGKTFSLEYRDKLSISAKKRPSNNKGKKFSEHACRRMSEAKQKFLSQNPGWTSPTSWKKGNLAWNKGKRYKLSCPSPLKGHKYTPEQIAAKWEKESATKRKNGSFNTSKAEDKLYKDLCIMFGTEDVIRQYTDKDRYPFACDFYIPSKDLFIELNLHWAHGEHPFDSTRDSDTICIWKEKAITSDYYKSAVQHWTIADPLKQATAKQNNLNYIALYKGDCIHDFI